jgi:hypothetical protein
LAGVLRDRAASRLSSTNRWRTRATVSVLTSTASAIRSSVQAGPPGAASALSRMRAWASFWAAALPAAIRSRSCRRSSAVRVTLYFFTGFSRWRVPIRSTDSDQVRKLTVVIY